MSEVNFDSGAVQSYLGILQGVISRMAENSSACKTWCITLVSAIAVVASDKPARYIWVALIPIALFLFLDSYYLGLERRFRDRYTDFVRKLHLHSATDDDLFVVASGRMSVRDLFCATGCAFLSLAVWPFYGVLALMLFVVRHLLSLDGRG